ncbi:ABC transporter, permease protein, DrrB family [SAR86 cluster bacterium SAR86E]|jgi:ABC-2 type transport system permease protein|uniref:Transport permease protein n=1 Tax=SAR86 cluster bacterium SAR86E TaxID=1208365 RepID=K6GJX5_9GAMM|nr:ABC transporter, permease protein, DrrB family [SAR86 cluster bacterium SAR86E]
MFSKPQLHLASIFLKIFFRDRQSLFFSLLVPLIFTGVFLFSENEPPKIKLGLVNQSSSALAKDFVEMVNNEPLFELTIGTEDSLKIELIDGNQTAILIVPQSFDYLADVAKLRLMLDASQVRQIGAIQDALNTSLLSIEREIRNIEPMFQLSLEDVKARPQRYIDFLLPGILAYMLMNLCIAGSGFNIVEYRRRGILKRLFVTPIQPKDFIISIVLARMLIVLIQISVILALAINLLNIQVMGGLPSLYGMVILGTFIFLCIGFFLGSLAKTQESIRPIVALVTFPQLILSGIFFPITSLPTIIQPIANTLPLSVLASGLRDIANDGISLFTINGTLIGVLLWIFISFLLATQFFKWKKVAS